MPGGDQSSYTDKQKRKAERIEESYEKRGTPKKEAESRAWATVNILWLPSTNERRPLVENNDSRFVHSPHHFSRKERPWQVN